MPAKAIINRAAQAAIAGFAVFWTGCSGTYEYVSSARARITEAPAITTPVPHRKGAAVGIAARLNRTSNDKLNSFVKTGSWSGTGVGDYRVSWEPHTLGMDARLILNLEDPPGKTLALADFYATINTRVEDPWWTSSSLGGFGITFPFSWGYFRFSPALGQHRYRMKVVETTVVGECGDGCTITSREYEVRDGSPIATWSATLWWPSEISGLPLTPHVGYQYTRMYVLAERRWLETFALRKVSLDFGLRRETQWITAGISLSHESLRHDDVHESYVKTRVNLEKTFGKRR